MQSTSTALLLLGLFMVAGCGSQETGKAPSPAAPAPPASPAREAVELHSATFQEWLLARQAIDSAAAWHKPSPIHSPFGFYANDAKAVGKDDKDIVALDVATGNTSVILTTEAESNDYGVSRDGKRIAQGWFREQEFFCTLYDAEGGKVLNTLADLERNVQLPVFHDSHPWLAFHTSQSTLYVHDFSAGTNRVAPGIIFA